MAVVVALALLGAGCGSDGDARAERLCGRIERQRTADVELTVDEQLAEEAIRVRIAPYDIADELALIAASHLAATEGTGPIIPPERLAAAEGEIESWIEDHCAPKAAS
jgi:hypothetical protein